MKKIDLESLKELLKLKMPILVEDLPESLFEDAVILNSDCDVSELNGHYEGLEFVPPMWYEILCDKCKSKSTLLIINGINNESEEDQLKFVEILKYHKVSTFMLPKNCAIITTAYDMNSKKVAEEIYSLTAHI